MTFWRTETLYKRLPEENLIKPYTKEHVTNCAYELCLGSEAFITSTSDKLKVELTEKEPLVIPPGQFALLLTEEVIKVPLNAIAFISMRFGIKRRGLINVSGFHVDPGFGGRLKFSVYNAGSSPITITRGDRVFLIWYADLDGITEDGYGDAGSDQNIISSDDQNVMHGKIASPAELKAQIDTLKHSVVNLKWMLGAIGALFVAIVARTFFSLGPSPTDLEKFRAEIMMEVRQELLVFKNDTPNTKPKTTNPEDTQDKLENQDQEENPGDASDTKEK